MTTNSTSLFDNAVCLNLDISVWGGKSTLKRSDLPPQALALLPEEELASLGSKSLIDPETLRPFSSIKAKARRLLETWGVRFLGGYLIKNDDLPSIQDSLDLLGEEFANAKSNFLGHYETATEEWVNAHPQWKDMLALALPTPAKLESRFSYGYQVYVLQEPDSSLAPKGQCNNLSSQTKNLGSSILDEIAQAIKNFVNITFTDKRMLKPNFTSKSLDGLQTIQDKLTNWSFVDPRLGKLQVYITQLRDLYNIGESFMTPQNIKMLLTFLTDASNIDDFLESYDPSQGSTGARTDSINLLASLGGDVPQPQPQPQPQAQPTQPISSVIIDGAPSPQPQPNVAVASTNTPPSADIIITGAPLPQHQPPVASHSIPSAGRSDGVRVPHLTPEMLANLQTQVQAQIAQIDTSTYSTYSTYTPDKVISTVDIQLAPAPATEDKPKPQDGEPPLSYGGLLIF